MKVKQGFTDRDTGATYKPGDIYAGTAERISELREGGYLTKTDVEPTPEPEVAPEPTPEPAPAPHKRK